MMSAWRYRGAKPSTWWTAANAAPILIDATSPLRMAPTRTSYQRHGHPPRLGKLRSRDRTFGGRQAAAGRRDRRPATSTTSYVDAHHCNGAINISEWQRAAADAAKISTQTETYTLAASIQVAVGGKHGAMLM